MMDDTERWILEFLTYEAEHRRARAVDVFARTVYQRAWGRAGEDCSGPKPGEPNSARAWTYHGFAALDRARLGITF
jgi:hypothetical protein